MNQSYYFSRYFPMLLKKCDAWADFTGVGKYADASGTAILFDTEFGIAVITLITDMPKLCSKNENIKLVYRVDGENEGLLPLLYNGNTVFSAFLTKCYIIDELFDKCLEITDNDGNAVAYGTIQKNHKIKK